MLLISVLVNSNPPFNFPQGQPPGQEISSTYFANFFWVVPYWLSTIKYYIYIYKDIWYKNHINCCNFSSLSCTSGAKNTVPSEGEGPMPLAAERMESKTFFCRSFRRAASWQRCLTGRNVPCTKEELGQRITTKWYKLKYLLGKSLKYLKILKVDMLKWMHPRKFVRNLLQWQKGQRWRSACGTFWLCSASCFGSSLGNKSIHSFKHYLNVMSCGECVFLESSTWCNTVQQQHLWQPSHSWIANP